MKKTMVIGAFLFVLASCTDSKTNDETVALKDSTQLSQDLDSLDAKVKEDSLVEKAKEIESTKAKAVETTKTKK